APGRSLVGAGLGRLRGGEQRQAARVGGSRCRGLDVVVLDAHARTCSRASEWLATAARAASSSARRLRASLLDSRRRTGAPAENAVAVLGSQATDARTGDLPPHTWASTLPTSAWL